MIPGVRSCYNKPKNVEAALELSGGQRLEEGRSLLEKAYITTNRTLKGDLGEGSEEERCGGSVCFLKEYLSGLCSGCW